MKDSYSQFNLFNYYVIGGNHTLEEYKYLKNDTSFEYRKLYTSIKCSFFYLEDNDAIIWLATKHNDSNVYKKMNYGDNLVALR